MIPIIVHNFKETVRIVKPKPKPKPKEDFWKKFDEILHQILF